MRNTKPIHSFRLCYTTRCWRMDHLFRPFHAGAVKRKFRTNIAIERSMQLISNFLWYNWVRANQRELFINKMIYENFSVTHIEMEIERFIKSKHTKSTVFTIGRINDAFVDGFG